MPNYQPFLISEFKSGLFNYLEPWIRPSDAFDPLENAYTYRGSLWKREGYVPFGAGIVISSYQIATGNGGQVLFTGTLSPVPIQVGTVVISDGTEIFTDNANGTLSSNATPPGQGTINYTTGAYQVNFTTAPGNAVAINANYTVQNSRLTYQDYLTTGSGGVTYTGTLVTYPIIPGTFNPFDGVESFTDNGQGVITGSAGGTGTIDYSTGAYSITFNAGVAAGINIYANFSPYLTSNYPIMGLKQWTNETNDTTELVALDTRRASLFDNTTEMFVPLNTISQTLWVSSGSTPPSSFNIGFSAVAPYTNALTPFTITVSYMGGSMTDNGTGGFTGVSPGLMVPATSTVNYSTGVIVVNFSANPAANLTFTVTATLAGDYFSGNFSNFFNSVNWLGDLYLTNNVDPITLFDGTNLSRPPFAITQADRTAYVNDIATCIEIDVYKNRLLVQRPTLTAAAAAAAGVPPLRGQSIRWSAINNPTNLVADVTGNGGELSAPTDDFLQCSSYLRDQFVVFFTNTAWTFRFTGSDFAPFRWDKINSTKSTNAPYAIIDYDERVTTIGYKGLLASDGVNVQRYDINIIDEFLDIDQFWIGQCYGVRFDNKNQSWMLYPSLGKTMSDSALIYNFLETTWSRYTITMSCLGLFYAVNDETWSSLAQKWENADFSWDTYLAQAKAPILLGGGQDGVVYWMDNGISDNGTAIASKIQSTRWNPFVGLGQKVQFGYIDFYYQSYGDDPNPPVISIDFFVDNSNNPTANRTLVMDGNATNNNYAMKRVYINAIGEFLKMEMDSSSYAPFKIIGMILYARPAGRITP